MHERSSQNVTRQTHFSVYINSAHEISFWLHFLSTNFAKDGPGPLDAFQTISLLPVSLSPFNLKSQTSAHQPLGLLFTGPRRWPAVAEGATRSVIIISTQGGKCLLPPNQHGPSWFRASPTLYSSTCEPTGLAWSVCVCLGVFFGSICILFFFPISMHLCWIHTPAFHYSILKGLLCLFVDVFGCLSYICHLRQPPGGSCTFWLPICCLCWAPENSASVNEDWQS